MNRLFISLITILLISNGIHAQDKPLRLGVAGLVHGHLGNVSGRLDRGDFEVVGIAEDNDEYRNSNELTGKVPADRFFKDLDEMLDKTRPEVVVCYGTTYDHLAVVRACAPRHIHVMVEKPLAASYRHAKEMEKLAKRYGIMVLTNYETSWYASNTYVKNIIDEGKLGKIFRINVYDGHQGPYEIGCSKRFTDWLCENPVLNGGGGSALDFGCYGANLATWIFGNKRPERVYATFRTNKPERYPVNDDDATIILEYDNATVQIMASWCWPFNRKDMYVYGLDGAAYQLKPDQVELRSGKTVTNVTAPELEAPMNDSFYYLKAAVRGDIKVLPEDLASLENNVIVNEILEAAVKSAKTGKPVRLKK